MARLHSIGAMRDAARRKLPRFAFDFINGGAGPESALRRNVHAFEQVRLTPRALTGCVTRNLSTNLFGRSYSAPFGIAPIGMANLVGSGTDVGLARAAARRELPYVLSTAASTGLETIAEAARGSWFQLYVGSDQSIVDDLIDRATSAGVSTLVVTVDVPAPGRRLRDLANNFGLPLRPTPRMALDVLTHPAWALSMAFGGAPRFANLERYERPGGGAQELAKLMASQSSPRLDWRLLGEIRRRWKGALVVKGIMHPEDALGLVRMGVDGLIVSNHGGRQLDAAPAPIEVLPHVRQAVGTGAAVLLDGGVRSGEDILRAVALGADLVLLGRPFLYAAAACGAEPGALQLMDLLTDELDRAFAMTGCASMEEARKVEVFRGEAPARNGGHEASAPGRTIDISPRITTYRSQV